MTNKSLKEEQAWASLPASDLATVGNRGMMPLSSLTNQVNTLVYSTCSNSGGPDSELPLMLHTATFLRLNLWIKNKATFKARLLDLLPCILPINFH